MPSLTADRKSEKPRSCNHPDPDRRFAITGHTGRPGDEMLIWQREDKQRALTLDLEPSRVTGLA
ncbi:MULTISPECIES: hypothetical protein [unclassified Pseudomonas]|uniref:hypothetical protein n=1 Tax=unclassified Pseudomonas TaxID=196821 RepID=UPI0011AEE81B|nr:MULTISPECIES: hypothetical protein [unclassified Pseudomonas]